MDFVSDVHLGGRVRDNVRPSWFYSIDGNTCQRGAKPLPARAVPLTVNCP